MAAAQCGYRDVVGRTLGTVVDAVVLVVTIAIGLAIRLIVLELVGDQVGKREPVMRGNEIDARRRPPGAAVEEIG